MKKLALNFCYMALCVLLWASCSKDETTVVVSDETLATNRWIKGNMETYYLWNDQLPDIDETKQSDSEAYFDLLLYADDKWSWITDDYASLAAEYSGVQITMGFDITPYYVDNTSTNIGFVVNYTYTGSAAAKAGLIRGDIIMKVNGTQITSANYQSIYQVVSGGESFSVQLAVVDNGTLTASGATYNLTATSITTDPAIYHTVLDVNGAKIGYLVYVEFVAGDDDKFLDTMDEIFTEFKSSGVTELVVDLRYNPGGEIDAAAHLASAIAPNTVVSSHDRLINLQFNDLVQAVYEQSYPDELYYNFPDNSSNMDMNTVYFLTTQETASASELLITGLSPYMDVVKIGEYTYGKYTGMYVIPDDNDEWAMAPVVMKYSNVNGYTDFVDGLEPNYAINDPSSRYRFGDLNDPMLAQAVTLITNGAVQMASATKSTKQKLMISTIALDLTKKQLKRNLFVPVDRNLPAFGK